MTITPVDDSNVTGTRTVSVSGTLPYSVTDHFYSIEDAVPVISTAMLTILDNDAAIEVSRGTGALALTEGGNATHTVTLTGQLSGAVVDVTSDDAGAVAPAALMVMVSAVSDADSTNETVTVTHAVNDGASAVAGDFTLSAAATLTFATGTTTSTGTVTLTAVDKAVDAADKRVTVTGSVASPDRRVITPTAATPTTTDDDTAGVEVDTDPSTPAVADTAALAVTEDGTTTTDTYTVVLATEPTGPVTVSDDTTTTPGVNDLDKVSAVPGALTFSTTNWATAQTVTSSDSNYTIAAARPAENITVTDNDTPGLAVNPTALMLTEQDATAGSGTYTVRLNALPSGMPRSRPRHP